MRFTPHSLLLCVPSRVFNYVSTRHFDGNCHHNYGIRCGPFPLSELLTCCAILSLECDYNEIKGFRVRLFFFYNTEFLPSFYRIFAILF